MLTHHSLTDSLIMISSHGDSTIHNCPVYAYYFFKFLYHIFPLLFLCLGTQIFTNTYSVQWRSVLYRLISMKQQVKMNSLGVYQMLYHLGLCNTASDIFTVMKFPNAFLKM